ncbi:MAG TPA: DUF308 domain-containing protein [Methanoregula sp.]|nr:DUF308 domain-containing protein [Methanoregula sp.]
MADDVTLSARDMVELQLFPWWLLLLWGILALLLGIALLMTPGMTTVLLITFMGAYWLVGGIFALASLAVDRTAMGWKIFLSVINIIAGILILLYPFYATLFALELVIIFIGFWACFVGAAHIIQAFTKKDWGNGVIGIISLIFGLLLLVNSFVAAILLPFVAGGFAIVMGLCSIFVSFMAKKCTDSVKAE